MGFWRTLKSLWGGFFYGLKAADNEISGSDGDGSVSVTIQQEVNENRVSKDLLKGELTEEVKQLRYRTYKVDGEAKKYEYFSPNFALKHEDKDDTKFIKYEKHEGCDILFLQPNTPLVESINETLKTVGNYGKQISYVINIERDFFPRYRIEEYTKLITAFKNKDGKCELDFYVSIYPNDKDFKSKGFVSEVKYIIDGRSSDMIDIDKLSFVSQHAYHIEDMRYYEFSNFKFINVTEFDGHYVLHFICDIDDDGKDLKAQYYNAEMDRKYREKEKKEVIYEMDPRMYKHTYICEGCGKEIVYDPAMLDMMRATHPDEEVSTNYSEYLDMQMAEQTIGKRLCSDCISKYYNGELDEDNGK